jgi:tetratricopeptide (TPR) repeat protein
MPRTSLGALYSNTEQYELAIEQYKQASQLSVSDHDRASDCANMGHVYRRWEKYPEAETAYLQAIQYRPSYDSAYLNLGMVYQLMREEEKALAAFQKAVELNPTDGGHNSSLVSALRRLGREDEAQRHMQIARPLMMKESEYNQACFESICGNVDEAIALLTKALDHKQETAAWAMKDPDLANIRNDLRFKQLMENKNSTR